MPTRRLVACVAGLALLGLLVPAMPSLAVVWQASVVLVILLLLLDLWTRPPSNAVTATWSPPDAAPVGRPSTYGWRLHNDAATPIHVAVRAVLPAALEGEPMADTLALEPGASEELAHEFTGLRRGQLALPPLGIGVQRGLRLLEYRSRVRAPGAISVVPGRPSGETAWLISRTAILEEAGSQTVRRLGADWEFESMRDYVVGDELRRIDWKASARRHRPMVRQFEIERNTEVILALDCGRLMGSLIDGVRKLDLAMTPVLDLAAVALQRGERVGLFAFDSAPRLYLPPRQGLVRLHAMRHGLAQLPEPDAPTSHVRAVAHLESAHRKRCTVIAFTDFTDELSSRDMYASLAALSRRHDLLFVAVGDPHLERLFATPDDDEAALFERATAGSLLTERRRTLERIERLGAWTLDAEPRRLTGPLIRRYLELRLGHGSG